MLIIIESQWEYVNVGAVSPSVGLTIFEVKFGEACVCVYMTHIYVIICIYGEKELKYSKRRVLVGSRCRLHGYLFHLQLSEMLRQMFTCRS